MSNLRALAAMIAAATLSACASMTSGTTQSIALQTTPSTGAECQIVNEKGTWLIPATPGSTTINRAYGDLVVTCAHKNGMKGSGKLADPSRLKDPAGWKPLPPRGSVDIAAIEAICASEAARVLAREYKSMLKENAGRPPSKTGLDISRFGKAVNQLFLMAVTKPDTCTVRLAAVGARHHSGN